MKHGKKYNESAKMIDRATFYEIEDAVALTKKAATANLMRQSKLISEQAVTDVTQTSRFVVQLCSRMELVRL